MMMHTVDRIQLEAFAQMLARPDPSDLPRRASVCRYDGGLAAIAAIKIWLTNG
jgi:hypothetical protein